jgi:hypothetical protein
MKKVLIFSHGAVEKYLKLPEGESSLNIQARHERGHRTVQRPAFAFRL